MTRMALGEALDDLRGKGFSVGTQMIDEPTTHHTPFGDIRIIPLEDGGFVLGVRDEQTGDGYPIGYPPEDGYVTEVAEKDGDKVTAHDKVVRKFLDVVYEEFDNIPEDNPVVRLHLETDDVVAVTHQDEDKMSESADEKLEEQ